jgi:hypothetical protein
MPFSAPSSGTPWIGVHVLSQFVFCPRAGLIEYEQQAEDEGEEAVDTAGPRLDFVPEFEPQLLEQQLGARLDRLKRDAKIVGSGAALAALGLLIATTVSWSHSEMAGFVIMLLGVGGLVVGAGLAVESFNKYSLVRQRLAEWQRAIPAEPDPLVHTPQTVHWFSLLKAGYESAPVREALRDPRLQLAGKPWRMLRRGNARIPVFRIRPGKSVKIYPKHRARVAAYSHLLEVGERQRSPFGIVLFPGRYDGVAIRNDPYNRKVFDDGRRLAQHTIAAAQRNVDPAAPDRNLCRSCPLGRPRVAGRREALRWGQPLPPYPFRGVDDRNYHSDCGDRFRWTPPHEYADRKRAR